jgi:hypothetical protein
MIRAGCSPRSVAPVPPIHLAAPRSAEGRHVPALLLLETDVGASHDPTESPAHRGGAHASTQTAVSVIAAMV